ncbi:MAG: ABC transporter permease [Betaproteobacteria bacterium]
MCRELGPLVSAIVLTGFAGASIAAEMGTMVVSEEIEALEAHAINPIRFLVVPRIIATTIMMDQTIDDRNGRMIRNAPRISIAVNSTASVMPVRSRGCSDMTIAGGRRGCVREPTWFGPCAPTVARARAHDDSSNSCDPAAVLRR